MGGIEKSGDTATATVALVGVTSSASSGTTRVHLGDLRAGENAPDLPPLVAPTSDSPVAAKLHLLQGRATAAQSNQEATAFTVDQASQAIAPITNVFRQFAFGNATPDRVADINSTNSSSGR